MVTVNSMTVSIPTIAQHLFCLFAIHIVIPRLLWESAWHDSCNMTTAVRQLWLGCTLTTFMQDLRFSQQSWWGFTSSEMWLYQRLMMLDNEGATFPKISGTPHPATHFQIPEAKIFNLNFLVCLCRSNSCNPIKTKKYAALNSSLCTPLATDTTKMNHRLKIQVFWDTHSITSLKTWIASTSTKRILNLTSPLLYAQTTRFITYHWASLTIYCPLVLAAGGAGCSGTRPVAGPPAPASDWT